MDVDIGLWNKQLEYVTSKEKSVLLSCGVGFGKTYANAVFAVISMYRYPGARIMMVARDVPQFKKSVLPELLKVFEMFELEEHIDYKYNRQSMEFSFKNGVIFFADKSTSFSFLTELSQSRLAFTSSIPKPNL